MSLLTLLQQQGGGTQNVSVPPVAVRLLAIAPAVLAGAATLPVASTALRLQALPPSGTSSVTVAAPVTRVSMVAVSPGVTSVTTRAVPAVTVRVFAVAPAVASGASPVAVPSSTVRVQALAPAVLGFIPVTVARLSLQAVAPEVSGGGGPGVVVIPRSSGEGVGSFVDIPPPPTP